jgi:hypothetical protein
MRLGYTGEAKAFMRWVITQVQRPRVEVAATRATVNPRTELVIRDGVGRLV